MRRTFSAHGDRACSPPKYPCIGCSSPGVVKVGKWKGNWPAWAIALILTCLVGFRTSTRAEPPRPIVSSVYRLRTWSTADGLPENSATAVTQTQDGYLWIGSWNGLVRYSGDRFALFDPANTPGLPAAGILRMRAMLKRQTAERTPLSIADILHEVAALAGRDAGQREVSLSLEVPSGLPPVWGDRIQLQQVVLNILLNGMDALSRQPPGTRRFTLKALKAEGDRVEVPVQDSGPGVPAADAARVFEPSFSTKPEGMGLGLAISKTIIVAHQGSIWVQNPPEGGADFCFTLPVAEGAEPRDP